MERPDSFEESQRKREVELRDSQARTAVLQGLVDLGQDASTLRADIETHRKAMEEKQAQLIKVQADIEKAENALYSKGDNGELDPSIADFARRFLLADASSKVGSRSSDRVALNRTRTAASVGPASSSALTHSRTSSSITPLSLTEQREATLQQLQSKYRCITADEDGNFYELFCATCGTNITVKSGEYLNGYPGLIAHVTNAHQMNKQEAEDYGAIGSRRLSDKDVKELLTGEQTIEKHGVNGSVPVQQNLKSIAASALGVSQATKAARQSDTPFAGTANNPFHQWLGRPSMHNNGNLVNGESHSDDEIPLAKRQRTE